MLLLRSHGALFHLYALNGRPQAAQLLVQPLVAPEDEVHAIDLRDALRHVELPMGLSTLALWAPFQSKDGTSFDSSKKKHGDSTYK